MTSPSGEPTRGTFIFCKMLFSLFETRRPAYMAMAVDVARSKSFRRALWSKYKIGRDSEVEDPSIPIQIRRIRDIVAALGIPVIRVEPFEADDVIATLTSICASDEVECVVCSQDKDLHQLIGPNVRMFDHRTGDWWGEAEVLLKWGVPPSKVLDVQTLWGDTTDGVPGVSGIGEVNAKALIKKYGSVAGVLEAAEDLSPSIQRGLAAADLDLCRKLVELRRDVPINVSPRDLEFDGFDWASAKPLFRELGFRQWS